ncbi:MAG: glycosyltransferase family 4 protein [Clostridiales bacterium]|nr:glycosyltransferase family 4 protein [Clostridiales bacterium]MCF8021662.1 glycosyltransferase family 4 protein [Clostridiales bacterium]
MRILMLSWEYPPKSIGGLAQHLYDLSRTLANLNIEVHVLTCGTQGAKDFEKINKVYVHRVMPYDISSPDFVTWVSQFNVAMLEKAIPLITELNFDVLHAHDWLVAYTARALKHSCNIPLVCTIHATEYGRNYGLHNNTQRHISDIEWWLAYESWQVICCSYYMERELENIFQIPEDKIKVIPNGVNPENFAIKQHSTNREDYASTDEKIVFYVGRLVREKGVQLLLDSAPKVLSRHPNTKFIISGKGPHMDALRHQAVQLNVAHKVYFTGYVDENLRNSLYSWSDVAVFPSLYEPFGIVAIEAMAARVPVIVADTGGLSEIIVHNSDGLKFYPGNANSLADMILKIFYEPGLSEKLDRNAYQKVKQRFNWTSIANSTLSVYRNVLNIQRNSYQPFNRLNLISNRFSRIFNKYQ